MNICVLVPAASQVTQAGVRIRYLRLQDELAQAGHSLTVLPLGAAIEEGGDEFDVYVVSKCYDARGPLLAAHLARAGKLVGPDIFDDYFSHESDSRFMRFELWLETVLASSAFALISTDRLGEVAARYTSLPVHKVNDPAPPIAYGALADALSAKREAALRSQCLDVTWFGIGNHPDFAVGISDLVAFSEQLLKLRAAGFEIALRVLTNFRNLAPDALASLHRVAADVHLEEWSEAREREALRDSLVSFLPVNGQAFSAAKSLNRAVTALAHGSQVLSAGYPLYQSLDPFIYRDADRLARDMRADTLALRSETVHQLEDVFARRASPVREAKALVEFLSGVKAAARTRRPDTARTAVIHGRRSTREIHDMARRTGSLSIASPFCEMKADFDMRFSLSAESGLQGFVATGSASERTSRGRRLFGKRASPSRRYAPLALAGLAPGLGGPLGTLADTTTLGAFVSAYPRVIGEIERIVATLHPGTQCLVSEQEKTPWYVTTRCNIR